MDAVAAALKVNSNEISSDMKKTSFHFFTCILFFAKKN